MALLKTTQQNFRARYIKAIKKTVGDEDFLELPDKIDLKKIINHTYKNNQILVKDPTKLLLFRGSDRYGPEGKDGIFKTGFSARNGAARPAFKSMQGDVDAYSGTCASFNPAVGCLFPLLCADGSRSHGALDPMRLFVIYTDNAFHTYRVQKGLLEDVHVNPGGQRGIDIRSRLQLNAWAQEVILPGTVDSKKVLGYFRVWRLWKGKEYQHGIEFKIDPKFILNSKRTPVSKTIIKECADKVKPFTTKYYILKVNENGKNRQWQLAPK